MATCCLCVPRKLGLQVISVFVVLAGFWSLYNLFMAIGNTSQLVEYILASLPTLVAGYLCCKWLGNDSKENRSGMACAFLIITLVSLFMCAIAFFAYLN